MGLSGGAAQELKALFARACPDLAWRVRSRLPNLAACCCISSWSPCTEANGSMHCEQFSCCCSSLSLSTVCRATCAMCSTKEVKGFAFDLQTRQSSMPLLASALWAAREVRPPAAQSDPSSKRRGGRRKKEAPQDTAAAGTGAAQDTAPAALAAPAWQAGVGSSAAPAAVGPGAALAALGGGGGIIPAQPMLQASAGLAALMSGAGQAALGGVALGGGMPGLQLLGEAQQSFSFVQALTQALRVSRLHATFAMLREAKLRRFL